MSALLLVPGVPKQSNSKGQRLARGGAGVEVLASRPRKEVCGALGEGGPGRGGRGRLQQEASRSQAGEGGREGSKSSCGVAFPEGGALGMGAHELGRAGREGGVTPGFIRHEGCR